MSETLVGVIMNLGADYISHPTSIGRVTPHHEVKYVDEKGNEVPVGESGELALRGPQVLKEYYKKDEANSKSFLPGRFFLTGDVGKVDKDGFHYLLDRAVGCCLVAFGDHASARSPFNFPFLTSGRSFLNSREQKDMLIRAGENIWTYTVLRVWRYLPLTFFSRPPSAAYQSTDCIDVENALYQHPAVLDCAAVGLPHRVLGEEVAAVVTLKKEFRGKVSAQDIIAHCKKNLSSFKVPVFVLFYDETLPRNVSRRRDRLKTGLARLLTFAIPYPLSRPERLSSLRCVMLSRPRPRRPVLPSFEGVLLQNTSRKMKQFGYSGFYKITALRSYTYVVVHFGNCSS